VDFSFISDEQFRNSLTSDYRELNTCVEAESWKAVHVLAGSMVEALLVEYLVVSGTSPGGKNPLNLTLDEAIKACQATGVIQKSTASLCDVIRDYRNLIHPGRLIRLQQEVTAEGARIAANLVSLITREVALKRKATYGPTAEQIVKKLRTDQHSLSVIPQLLGETNPHERIRIVSSLLPETYINAESDFLVEEEVQARLRTAYRQTLDLLPVKEKVKIAEKFARMIREDSAEQIETYGDAFFVVDDIAHLGPQDAALTLRYLTNRIEQPGAIVTDGILRAMSGLAKFVEIADIENFSDMLIRLVLRQKSEDLLSKALALIGTIYDSADDPKKRIMEKRIAERIKIGKKNDYPPSVQERLTKVDGMWTDIPF
jgi:hypothetical protein